MTADNSISTDTEGLDPCPVCKSRLVTLFERHEGRLFAVSCENDDCHFMVEAFGSTRDDAVRQWNTRDVAQSASEAALVKKLKAALLEITKDGPTWRAQRIACAVLAQCSGDWDENPAQQSPDHIEKTPAGTDWKMEAERANRLLADAEGIIAEYKARAIEITREHRNA